jgi:hypothetical protein
MIRREALRRYGTLTGSVAFGVAGRYSDEDWLISPAAFEKLDLPVRRVQLYGTLGAFSTCRREVAFRQFATYREGRINLIVWFSEEFARQWMKAHHHCLVERPKSKARRQAIFRHYMEGPRLP